MSQGKTAFLLFLVVIMLGMLYNLFTTPNVAAASAVIGTSNNKWKIERYDDFQKGNSCYILDGHRGISCVPDKADR